MSKGEDLLEHVNKVKAIMNRLAYLEVPVRDKDIVMALLKGLPMSFEYLIIIMKSMPMKEITTEYVSTHLMREIPKCKEKEIQG